MARNVNKEVDQTTATQSDASTSNGATVPAAPAAAPAADTRFKKITVPNDPVYGDKAGTQMNRKDFILLLADLGKSRSEITSIIKGIPKEQGGDPNFRYQIVFQTTRSLPKDRYPNLRPGHQKKTEATAPASTDGAAS